MTVRDMHIEVEQSLQKIAANKTRKFLPEEIDWVLNKMQHRYIQQVMHPILPSTKTGGRLYAQQIPKYQQDQFSIDAIKQLIVSRKPQPCYYYNEEKNVSYLPSDYLYLMSDTSVSVSTCKEEASTSGETLDVLLVQFPVSPLTSGPYYTSLSFTIGTYSIDIPSGLPLGNSYAGFKKKEDVDFIRDYVLYELRKQGLVVYWEKYGSIYKQGYMVFPSDPGSISLEIDGASITPQTTSIELNLTTYYSRTGDNIYADNRLSSSDQIGTLLTTPFHKTTIESPISELEGTSLYTYIDNSFKVRTTILSYVRIPQVISLLLGTNCELSDSSHQVICDLAVEYIAGRLGDEKGNILSGKDLDTRVII